jgi:hypothetical protein
MGEIRGLESISGEQSATSIIITRLGGKPENIEVVIGNHDVNFNIFTVINNEINTAHFVALLHDLNNIDGTIQFGLLNLFSPGEFSQGSAMLQSHFVASEGIIAFTKREVLVPEPRAVILLSLGLAGLSFARYRRQS